MDILLVMAIGFVIGFLLFPNKKLTFSHIIQFVCIYLLIFSMGIILGSKENFKEELYTIGFQSFIFAIIPIIFSVIFVYFLTVKLLKKKDSKK